MSGFDEFRDLADEFTSGDEFSDATLYRVAVSSYDPVTGDDAGFPEVATGIPCRVFVDGFTSRSQEGAFTSAVSITINVEPRSGDRIELGQMSYIVESVDPVAPDGNPIIWFALANQ